MSKLNDLIKELCPDGVEYKKLNEISEMKRGTSVTKKDIIEGDIPVISGGREPAYYCDTFNRDGETITVAGSGAGAGYVQYWTVPIFVCDAFSIKGKDCVKTKYLYYYLSNMQEYIYSTKKGGGVPHVHISSIDNMKIPIPPLPVQCEIVRILDNFTALTSALTSALTAELTAQRKRYSGFLNSLLSFEGRDAQRGTLEKLGDIAVNLDSRRIAVTKHNRKAGIYPYYGASGIVDYVDDYIFDGDFLLVSEDGANLVARSTPIAFSITGKNWVNNHAHVLKFDNIYLQKYVEIYLNLLDLSPYISKGAQPKLSQTSLKKIILHIPDDSRIRYVVDILDRFDKLCNDLSEGLPAEIAARQKQYEYYRDKLLTFKEKES